ncbi:hypothetical protein [Streptomyces lateritius]|uniref:hypothetical protein n=1 Tax=Streptomyces lateritius TaxID=67313 RepID=UPI0016757BA8|nr:hypothetical protein [Streptomyces lateritius]GGU11717.1 hypothetical protein GCM10010272_66070 [Streptomyces lateritius]
MTSDSVEKLLADVCGTLARAGFDVASAADEGSPGLRVRGETDSVMVGWVTGSELHPESRAGAEYEGFRAALRSALLAILTQAGYAVQMDRETGDVRVRLLA